jgi:hypothetical protein
MSSDATTQPGLLPFFHQRDAVAHLRPLQVLWGVDHFNASKKTIVKKYYYGTVREFKKLVLSFPVSCWHYYEVLMENKNHSLYFDIEFDAFRQKPASANTDYHLRLKYIGVGDSFRRSAYVDLYKNLVSEELSEKKCKFYSIMYMRLLLEFIKLQFDDVIVVNADDILLLNSCRGNKYSVHIIVKKLVFDTNRVSMRYFVWEFGRFLWRRVNKICAVIIQKEANPDLLNVSDQMMIRLLFLDESGSEGDWFINSGVGIDESVYTKNRCFRLVGMHKMRLDGTRGVRLLLCHIKIHHATKRTGTCSRHIARQTFGHISRIILCVLS